MPRSSVLTKVLPSLWCIFIHFWPYTKKYFGLLLGSAAALAFVAGFELLEPWPLKFIIDHLIAMRLEQPVVDGHGNDGAGLSLVLAMSACGFVAVIGLGALANYLSTIGFALVSNRVLVEVRRDLYRHLQSLSLSFHAKSKNGDMVLRVISDVGQLMDVVITAILPLLGNVLVLLGMTCVMFWMNWRLALLASATVPLFWFSTTRLSRRIADAARQERKREGAMAATAAESMSAIKTVQALSLEENFAGLFSSQNSKSLGEGVKAKRLSARLERTVDLLIGLATAMVLWFGGWLVISQSLTPGELLVFLAYLKSVFKPVRNFAKYTARMAKAAAAGERILEIFATHPEIRDTPTATAAPALRGDIRFDKVWFGYDPAEPVLRGIDLEVAAGQWVAVVGPSGNGKSTLVSLVSRLYDPQQGRILIDGRDIREYTVGSLRSQASVVLQDNLLFAGTIRENIACTDPDVSLGEIVAASRLANADGFIQAMPRGYNTLVGERGVTLSQGQRQRIAIARAAIRKTPILILDEPTTGLDEENQEVVIDALGHLAQGRTTLLITHDLCWASKAEVIIYLEDGVILERGTHASLLRANGRYARLYRLYQAGTANPDHSPEPTYAIGK